MLALTSTTTIGSAIRPNSLSLSGTISFAPSTLTNGRATEGVDYSVGTGATSWSISGDDHVDIAVSVLNDQQVEGNESVVVLLNEDPTHYIRAAESAEAAISDNDDWGWDTPTGDQLYFTQSKYLPGNDHLGDSGLSTMSHSGQITSWSDGGVHADVTGLFSDPGIIGETSSTNGPLNLDLQFGKDDLSGNVSFQTPSGAPFTTIDANELFCGIGWSYTINNTGAALHTVTVTIK